MARQQGTLLPASHPYVQRVRRIGEKIAQVASESFGGGRVDHMKVCTVLPTLHDCLPVIHGHGALLSPTVMVHCKMDLMGRDSS